ncbi:MAG: hypothetical protein WBC44_16005 [Planctomycetaceae bacterium]
MAEATARSPAAVSKRVAGSWRAKRQESRPAGRRARRVLAAFGVVLLLVLFAYLLVAPLGRPKAALILARPTAGTAKELSADSPFVDRDFAAIAEATRELLIGPPIDLTAELPPSDVFGPRLRASFPESDVLIVYVQADATSENGRAVLLWGNDPGESERRRFPIRDLLANLSEHPAATKVLLLDATDPGIDRRAGRIDEEFSRRLSEECRSGPAGVWVLASHGAGETSHFSPALARSVFGYWIGRGLGGAADLDRDGFLRLRELHQFVDSGVSTWTRRTTGGRETQTPVLLTCGLPRASRADPMLLPAPRRIRAEREGAVLHSALTAADEARTKSSATATSADDPTTEASPAETNAADRQGTQTAKGNSVARGAKSDAAQTGAENGADAAKSEGSSREIEPTADSPTAVQLLNAGWRLRDDLEQGKTVRLDPRRDTPHLWRAYVRRLLEIEKAIFTGTETEQIAAARELRRLVVPLGRWAAGGDPEPDAAEPARSLMTVRSGEPSWERHSFGMEESRAADDGVALSSELATLVAAYDRMIINGSREEFAKWLSEIAPGNSRYVELVLAGRLTAMPDLDWEIVRTALKTRRIAERVAATVEAATWMAPVVEDADKLRHAAERLLLDGIGENRQSVADDLLTNARSRYEAVADDVAAIREATAFRNELLDLAPVLVAWHRRTKTLPGPRTPHHAETVALLGATEELATALDSPSPATVDRVRSAAAKARTLLAIVQAGSSPDYVRGTLVVPPDPADEYMRIRALLMTTLPAAQDRVRLRDAQRRAEQSLVMSRPWTEESRRPPRTMVVPANDDLLELMELEYRLASLAAGDAARERFEPVAAAYRAIAAAPDATSDERPAGIPGFESALREYWRRTLPVVAEPPPLDGTLDPGDRLAELRAADRALRLLDARDALRIGPFPTAPLRAELLATLLRGQARRTDRERQDTPSDDRGSAAALASRSREAAEKISDRDLDAPQPPTLVIEGTSAVSLESSETASVELTVVNRSGEPTDVWLVLDYDPTLVSIEKASSETSPSYRLLQQVEGPAVELVDPRRFRRPDLDGSVPPAMRIASQERRSLTFQLNRESGAGRATRVIVRAIARPVSDVDAPADVSTTRQDVVVALPTLAPTELIVEGPPGTVGVDAGAIVVSPFPNRITPFRLSLANRTRNSATIDVELFAVTANTSVRGEPRTTSQLPTVIGIDRNAAASLLARWTDGAPLFSVAELALPADGTPVAIPFPKPAPGGVGPRPAVEQGLLVVVTDRATGHRSVHPVVFRPQHPRRYLEPIVRYDAVAERIEIRVEPRDPALMPPGGSRVSCEVVEPLPVEVARRLEGIITPDGKPAELFVETSGLRADAVTLRLSVDGYPRAFLYRVPLSGSRDDVPPETGSAAVRIIAPSPGASYRSPIDSVPVTIEVDAPVGTRWDAGDAVEIGFDRDRDRELQGEKSILLQSDRQIAVTVQQLSPGGLVSIESVVADFRLDLPSDHIERGRVNIIGRIVAGGREAWSPPVEVAFDDVPPPIRRVRLSKGQVVAGEPLRVVAEASDGGLSGIRRVLVGIDLDRTGEFSAEPKPVAAVNERGRWVATLDTATLLPGPYFVLVQAVDAVGIVGSYSRERFEVVTPEQRAAAESAAVNRVTGFVHYRGRPMSGFDVRLEALPPETPTTSDSPSAPEKPNVAAGVVKIPPVATDEVGAFEISQVPPGRYRISSSGLYANRRREGSLEIAVPPFPTEAPPVEIAVDPR